MIAMILPTQNTEWGFWGSIERLEHAAADIAEAWALASAAIAAKTGASPEGVRNFLDSRHGRHFADDVADSLARGEALAIAIDTAITRWVGWKIDRRTSRETGIPAGLPYLTGLVTHFEVLADA